MLSVYGLIWFNRWFDLILKTLMTTKLGLHLFRKVFFFLLFKQSVGFLFHEWWLDKSQKSGDPYQVTAVQVSSSSSPNLVQTLSADIIDVSMRLKGK
ncbi:hypothetical protein YC2023_117661 [Brassica napus]